MDFNLTLFLLRFCWAESPTYFSYLLEMFYIIVVFNENLKVIVVPKPNLHSYLLAVGEFKKQSQH